MTDFIHDTFDPHPGVTLAYRRTEGRAPGVIFLGGFKSDMTGTKAAYLENLCRKNGQAFVRFDYTGHGLSSGRFEDGNIGAWLQDALDVFDAQTNGPQIVVGSSMGGWIALLLALRRRERVAGLVLIAPAPDFSEDIYHKEFTATQRRELAEQGFTLHPSDYGTPYKLTRQLFEDGKNHLLLHADIDIPSPIRIIHGKQDDAVPWQKSEKIKGRLTSRDVEIHWVEDGDHRLSRDEDLKLLGKMVMDLARQPAG